MKTFLICVAQVLWLAGCGCQTPQVKGEPGAAEREAVLVATMDALLQHYLHEQQACEQYVVDADPAVLDRFRTHYPAKLVVSPAEHRLPAFRVPGVMLVTVKHTIILAADGHHAWVRLREEVGPRAAVFYTITLKRRGDGSWKVLQSVCGPWA